MEIYGDKFKFINEHQKLFWEVENILRTGSFDFEMIRLLLGEKEIEFDDSELYLVLQNLIANDKKVIRNEYWDKATTYELLEQRLWDSNYQKSYYSFEDGILSNKTFLLIADTHIGNDKMFNAKLIHNLYNYAIKCGATKCFHLGDLFMGNQYLLDDFEGEFNKQVNLFINEYPKPNPNEMKTYCLLGNHDKPMNQFLQDMAWWRASDLRKLSIYDPSFYMIPRGKWSAKLNGIDFHFSHRLFMNWMIEDLKIRSIEEIKRVDMFLDSDFDVLISGHLHTGIAYTTPDMFRDCNKLYLGVPSTTNVNVGGVISYLVYMYPETNSMEVSIIGCSNDLNIYEVDRINWEFGKKNKKYCRTL